MSPDWDDLHRLVASVTRRVLRNADDAEDAAQEAILRAYRAIHSGVVPANLEAWLTTIAKREAFRVYGRQRASERLREDLVSLTKAQERTCPGMPDPANVIADRLTVRQLLSDMTPEGRELVLRKYALDQSSSEIAAALDGSANTVRVRLHRTLEQIRLSQREHPTARGTGGMAEPIQTYET